ncbi:MAG: hypothetical protein OEY89_12535 [Gammaproteobacteria bacterium]|nr:hypothetical protein [Gammaproteobacteria bacterium]
MGKTDMDSKQITPAEVKAFIQDNLTHINRDSGEIEWVDKNGNNMETGFSDDVYEAINKAILIERETIEIIY